MICFLQCWCFWQSVAGAGVRWCLLITKCVPSCLLKMLFLNLFLWFSFHQKKKKQYLNYMSHCLISFTYISGIWAFVWLELIKTKLPQPSGAASCDPSTGKSGPRNETRQCVIRTCYLPSTLPYPWSWTCWTGGHRNQHSPRGVGI